MPDDPTPQRTVSQRSRNWLVAGLVAAALAGTLVLSAMGARTQAWFFTVAYGVLDPLSAVFAGFYAWQLLRKKNWLLGILLVLLALVMVGWTVEHWSQLRQLLHNIQ
jgi:uncharacterized membrane protein (UPF0182 family)